jgi:Cdc6-like AAA superfamily ATPase
MLRSSEWANWLDAKQRCLWIHGIPGAGKTVLMSYLIDQLKQHRNSQGDRKIAYVYYYSYFGHNQDETTPFLRWAINQLCRQASLVPGSVYDMFKYGGEPSLIDLLKALADVLDEFEMTYVMIDAIDESNPRDDLLKVLRDLATDSRFQKLQILASSREYIDIDRVMREFSVAVTMANTFVEEDIRRHVRSSLQSNSRFGRWPRDLLNGVEDAVSIGAKGMYVVFHIEWVNCSSH